MAYIALRNEKKLADVVRRAFGDLSAADTKRAGAAILRANPQLADTGAITPGTVVVVPGVPGLPRAAAPEQSDAPARDVVQMLAESVDRYRKDLGEAARQEREAAKEATAVLKSKELKGALRGLPDADDYLKKANAGVKARIENNEARDRFIKLLTQAKADLDALVETLD